MHFLSKKPKKKNGLKLYGKLLKKISKFGGIIPKRINLDNSDHDNAQKNTFFPKKKKKKKKKTKQKPQFPRKKDKWNYMANIKKKSFFARSSLDIFVRDNSPPRQPTPDDAQKTLFQSNLANFFFVSQSAFRGILIYLFGIIHDTYDIWNVSEHVILQPQTPKKKIVSQSAFRGILLYLFGIIHDTYGIWNVSERVIFACKTKKKHFLQSKCVQNNFDIFARDNSWHLFLALSVRTCKMMCSDTCQMS